MSDTSKKSPEQIEKELSVGNFAMQQARTIGFTVGGTLAGLGLAWGANKTQLVSWLTKKMPSIIKPFSKKTAEKLAEELTDPKQAAEIGDLAKKASYGLGAIGGLFTGTTASMYEHWAKVEREQLSVKEINKDVASIMEKRVQFEDTLDKQHAAIKSILEKHKESPKAETITDRREQSAHAENTRG